MDITDIDFILSHFEEPLFPRKMMTAISNGQFSITSKDDILKKCDQANFIDCRINAYPEYTDYKGIVLYPPNFVFIDLDLSTFSKYKDPKKMLDISLKITLKKIKESSNQEPHHSPNLSSDLQHSQNQHLCIKPIYPTVLWTGNGYHIYLPLKAIVLDQYEQFSKDKFPNLFSTYYGKYYDYSVSEVFLKFAEEYFTAGKADPQHRPKYKTSLIRIPNTHNSKCLAKGASMEEESKVKVIQKWNRYRLPIQLLTKYFRRWITQEEINQKSWLRKNPYAHENQINKTDNFEIQWIERLLKRGIPDGRKETLRLILGPYLTKRKSYEDAVIILQRWLDKCNEQKQLDRNFNPKQRIDVSLKNPRGYLKLENLKLKYRWLYDAINNDRR